MEIKKLLKRYLKEYDVYGSPIAKDVLDFVDKYGNFFEPFNAFRWDTTSEGHNYWYGKALRWPMYIYNNIDKIDGVSREAILYSLKDTLYDLTKYYHSPNDQIDIYDDAVKLYNKLDSNQ